jgi:hypothetical protein
MENMNGDGEEMMMLDIRPDSACYVDDYHAELSAKASAE